MTRRRIAVLVILALVLAFAACTLNPQPLPPLDDNRATGGNDAGFSLADGGSAPGENEVPGDGGSSAGDASAQPDIDAATDAGDAGDAGDASDAGDADAAID